MLRSVVPRFARFPRLLPLVGAWAAAVPAARALLLPVLALLALSGCRTVQTVGGERTGSLPPDFGRHTLADVLGHLAGADTLRGLSGEATLVLQSPQQSGTFDARLAAAPDGRAYVQVSAFGIAGARALLRPDSAFVHNLLQREFVAVDAARAADVLPIPVAPSDFFDVLAGTFRPADASGYVLSVDRPNGLYLLRSTDGRRVVSVDPRVWRVARAVRYMTSGGGIGEEVLWANYTATRGAVLPRRVTVRQPASSTTVVLLLSGVGPDASPPIPARLSVPSGTSRRTL